MKILFSIFLVTIGLTIATTLGCPGNTPSPLPPQPDADSSSPPAPTAPLGACASQVSPADCALACTTLASAGCKTIAGTPDAGNPSCASFLIRDLGTCKVPNATTHRALTCVDIESVKSAQDAIALGFVCQ